MKASSQDLRQRVVRAVDEGRTRAEIAQLFGVWLATIKRYLKQRRESGHLIPKAIPGRPAKKGGALQVGLGTQLAAHPDMTLDEHCRLWETEHGQRVSTATMSRAITRLGWTRKKKTLVASERDETARATWRKQARQHTNQQWVFVDEGGSHIALTPLYARAPRGRRAVGRVPRNYGANITLIASLSLQGMGEALILEGAADASAFELYVEQILTPSLHSGQTVVMDNLSIHQGVRLRKAIEAKGCHLLYLPSYSPDLSPIEEAFSKLKTFLRQVGTRTREALQEAIAAALQAITAQDARGWFTHCGYLAEEPSRQDKTVIGILGWQTSVRTTVGLAVFYCRKETTGFPQPAWGAPWKHRAKAKGVDERRFFSCLSNGLKGAEASMPYLFVRETLIGQVYPKWGGKGE